MGISVIDSMSVFNYDEFARGVVMSTCNFYYAMLYSNEWPSHFDVIENHKFDDHWSVSA